MIYRFNSRSLENILKVPAYSSPSATDYDHGNAQLPGGGIGATARAICVVAALREYVPDVRGLAPR